MSATDDRELGRLRWRCRRGMRELDVLLRGWLEREFPTAPPALQDAFRGLLEAPDTEIHGLCLGRIAPATPEQGALIARILAAEAAGRPGAPAERC